MKNFIVRTITGIIFVAAIVSCFLNPIAMVVLFALVTGLTVWEFTGIVNEHVAATTLNRVICTVAGVWFFLAMFGFCWGIVNSAVFLVYLFTIMYLVISELYLKHENPINNWAYTMLSQMYIAMPLSLINVLAFMGSADGEVHYNYVLPLSVFVFLWVNDSGAYCCGSLLGRHKLFPRVSPGKSWEGSIGGAVLVVMGIYFLRKEVTSLEDEEKHIKFKSKDGDPRRRTIFMQGFVINIVNPLIWIYWVSVIALLTGELNLTVLERYIFFLGVLGSTLGLDILKCKLASLLQQIITAKTLNITNKICAVAMFIFAGYMVISMALYQFNPKVRAHEQQNEPQSTQMIKKIHNLQKADSITTLFHMPRIHTHGPANTHQDEKTSTKTE